MNSLSKLYNSLNKKYPSREDLTFKKLVNFQNHKDLPIHRWLRYREGYSVELVKRVIKELNIKGSVLDPFLGSGTTTYASALLGLNSYGIELNPFPAFVAKVKTRKYSKKFISDFQSIIPHLLKKNKPSQKPGLRILDKAFNVSVLNSLLEIRRNIDELKGNNKDLAFFTWLSLIEEVSNTYKEGNGIKYRGRFGYKRPPRRGTVGFEKYMKIVNESSSTEGWVVKNVHEIFNIRFNEILVDLNSMNYKYWKEPKIILGDVRETEILLSSLNNFNGIDLTIFSPPYANCFDYYEINKIELWMGGFTASYEDFKQQRKKGLVSNLNANLKNIEYFNQSLDTLLNEMDNKALWNTKIKDMLRGYFRDMSIALEKLYKVTNKKGHVVMVIGNSSYGNVIIPTDLLLAEIAEKIGFKISKIVKARQTNTSSQQMKILKDNGLDTSLLREGLVYLTKTA